MFWLDLDRFDRRAVNRHLAERVVGAQVGCPALGVRVQVIIEVDNGTPPGVYEVAQGFTGGCG